MFVEAVTPFPARLGRVGRRLAGGLAIVSADGDVLTFSLVSGPARGALALNGDGTFTYTPAANYSGSDSFTYRANDGTAEAR